MQIDKDLLQYCKDKEFPIDEMTIEDFKSVEDTLDFQFYRLGLEFRSLGKEILNALKKLNTGRKVVKTLNASKTIILKARLISSLFYCIHVSQSNKLHIL